MKIEWICTDPDNNQYGRQIAPKIYEFKELARDMDDYEEDEYIELTINLEEYTKEQIENYVSAYYSDVMEIQDIYDKDFEWIIAECIFEQDSGLY